MADSEDPATAEKTTLKHGSPIAAYVRLDHPTHPSTVTAVVTGTQAVPFSYL